MALFAVLVLISSASRVETQEDDSKTVVRMRVVMHQDLDEKSRQGKIYKDHFLDAKDDSDTQQKLQRLIIEELIISDQQLIEELLLNAQQRSAKRGLQREYGNFLSFIPSVTDLYMNSPFLRQLGWRHFARRWRGDNRRLDWQHGRIGSSIPQRRKDLAIHSDTNDKNPITRNTPASVDPPCHSSQNLSKCCSDYCTSKPAQSECIRKCTDIKHNLTCP